MNRTDYTIRATDLHNWLMGPGQIWEVSFTAGGTVVMHAVEINESGGCELVLDGETVASLGYWSSPHGALYAALDRLGVCPAGGEA